MIVLLIAIIYLFRALICVSCVLLFHHIYETKLNDVSIPFINKIRTNFPSVLLSVERRFHVDQPREYRLDMSQTP